MSTIRIKGDTSGYVDLSTGNSDGVLDISSSVSGAPVRTNSDLELQSGGVHVKNPSGIEGVIIDTDTSNSAVSGRFVLKNSSSAASVYYSDSLGWTFHTGTILGVTSGTQRMYLTPEGYQRLPYQPCFSAIRDAGNVSYNTEVIYNSVAVNVGSCYNASNGRFTAPVTGNYFFNVYGMGENGSGVTWLQIRKNGVVYNKHNPYFENNVSATKYQMASGSVVMQLNAGDYASVVTGSNAAFTMYGTGNAHNGFSGFLIG